MNPGASELEQEVFNELAGCCRGEDCGDCTHSRSITARPSNLLAPVVPDVVQDSNLGIISIHELCNPVPVENTASTADLATLLVRKCESGNQPARKTLRPAGGRHTAIETSVKKGFMKWKIQRESRKQPGRKHDVGWYAHLSLEWDSLDWTGNIAIPAHETCRKWLQRDSALFAEVQREMSQSAVAGTQQLQHERVSVLDDPALESGESSRCSEEIKFSLHTSRNRQWSSH